MHHPRATQAIREAFAVEPDAEVRAHLLRVASSLMAIPPDDEMIRAAWQSDDPTVREAATQLYPAAVYDSASAAAQPLTRAELAGEVSRPPRKKKKRL
jgi:hypothetical protein